jgi:Alpha-L-arabinofuranosidase B, catalytic
MQKKGAIVLGVGGDNSYWGQGTFFEGCMTSGYPSDETDNAVQSNIVPSWRRLTSYCLSVVSLPKSR